MKICNLGKSGSGKSTLEAKLENFGYNRIISYTTRKIRPGEVNGKEYYFIGKREFKSLIKKNVLMEYAEYDGNLYGSPKPIGSINNVIVVEPHGYEQIKNLYETQVIGVYLKICDEIAAERLVARNDNTNIESRKSEDNKLFDGIEDKVDIILDARQPVVKLVMSIFKHIKEREF